MEINLNGNGFGGVGMVNGMPDANGTGAVRETGGPGFTDAGSLRISSRDTLDKAGGIAASEPLAEVSDAELSRDDKLGRLVNSVFSLPPPAMPDFS